MSYLLQFGSFAAIFLAIDFVWLSLVAKNFYRKELGPLMLANPNFVAAGIFYVIFTVAAVMFVIQPAVEKGSWQHALGYGALFGLVTYATYDLTNLATLKGFSPKLVVVDLIWGTSVSAVTSLLCYLAVQRLS